MATNKVDAPAAPVSTTPTPPAAPTQQGSLVRLLILLGLLVVVVGAYVFDFLVAKPGAEAGERKIQEFVDERNKKGVRDAEPVTPQEISNLLGMKPTLVEKHPEENYEIEYYCWWGPVPVLNTRRQFISVVYYGVKEPRRFSSHHRNEKPPAEALPIPQEPTDEDGKPLPKPGPPGEEGKGVTEPPPAEAPAAEAPPPTDSPAKDTPSATDSPAKDAPPSKEP